MNAVILSRRFLLGLFATFVLAAPAAATDIEGLFARQNDLSGTYKISTGMAPDSTTYGGTLTLKTPRVVKSPRGTEINIYDLVWKLGSDSKDLPGVGVQGGDRLYVAFGTYEHYGLVFWCKFDMPSDLRSVLYDRIAMRAKSKKNTYVTFKGKSQPWWWYMDENTNGYGYYFHVNGKFGYTKIQRGNFPLDETEVGGMLKQVKPNGEISDDKGYYENFGLKVVDHGKNVIIHYLHDKDSYDGTGMRLADELVFGSWGASSDGGVGYYDFKGRQLVGAFAMTDSENRGVEILDVPDDVAARAPGLWK